MSFSSNGSSSMAMTLRLRSMADMACIPDGARDGISDGRRGFSEPGEQWAEFIDILFAADFFNAGADRAQVHGANGARTGFQTMRERADLTQIADHGGLGDLGGHG